MNAPTEHNESESTTPAAKPQPVRPPQSGPVLLWTGRVLTTLVSALFLMSAVMKLQAGPEMADQLAQSGFGPEILSSLAMIELACVVAYLIPQTAVLGAILLTGYMGGAICTHMRLAEPFLFQFGIGVAVWLGLYLREPRLWPLMPMRRL